MKIEIPYVGTVSFQEKLFELGTTNEIYYTIYVGQLFQNSLIRASDRQGRSDAIVPAWWAPAI